MVNSEFARAAITAAHAAWTCGDLEAMLRWYSDSMVYVCNSENARSEPFVAHGKSAFRRFLEPVLATSDNASFVDKCEFDEESQVARTRCVTLIRHRTSGLTLQGTYRQIVRFKSDLIVHLEEFHDITRLAAFWRMVNGVDVFSEPVGQTR